MDKRNQDTTGRGRNKTGDDSSFIKIGHQNGNAWDEKGRNQIFQIFVWHDDEINSIQFQYVENGNLVLSDRHGTGDGCKFDVVTLNFPSEYITWIRGHRNDYDNLSSITFGTNFGEYGPFGRITGHNQEFSFRLGRERQFGGFHGTADRNNVKSIGVYLKPIVTLD